MKLEEQLIRKSYYETFLMGTEKEHPVELLGRIYTMEQENGLADLSYIRFAQGEIYYHSKDFEAAIFKWEKVENELSAWARKNIGDAQVQLGQADTAEGMYKSVVTDCPTLTAETSLHLFDLYAKQHKVEEAFQVIRTAVAQDPDYPNVTGVARAFYEEQQDWNSAVDLAVQEALRTGSLYWFDVLQHYIEEGWTSGMSPHTFQRAMDTLYYVDTDRFSRMLASFWNSYRGSELYFTWLQSVNQLFRGMDVVPVRQAALLHEQTYEELLKGVYFVRELQELVPGLLTNWLRLTEPQVALLPSAAVLAWHSMFADSLETSTVQRAEELISSLAGTYSLSASMHLFQSILEWAKVNELEAGARLGWWAQEIMEHETYRVLVAGIGGSGKSSFIQSLIGEAVLSTPTAAVTVIREGDSLYMEEITDHGVHSVEELEVFQELTATQRRSKICASVALPSPFLQENGLTLLDTPGFDGRAGAGDVAEYMQLTDSLLLVLDVNAPFSDRERDIVLQLQQKVPHLPITFILNKMDTIYSEEEASRIIEGTRARVHMYFPGCAVLPYSSRYTSKQQLQELLRLIGVGRGRDMEQARNVKLLFLVQKLIQRLLEKRVEVEESLAEEIRWNEDMLSKLKIAVENVRDLEDEKTRAIKQLYRAMKTDMKKGMADSIVNVVRSCADYVREDSDFRNLDKELDAEINRRLQEYLQRKVLPQLHEALGEWTGSAEQELLQGQSHMNEMFEAFNALYQEERLQAACDFRVVDDWNRDADRMTIGIQLEEVSILRRFTPTQLLLKSAGKLFGAIPQNKAMLYNKYKKYLETESFEEAAASVIQQFFMQFDLFEKTLERDMHLFFKQPLSVLQDAVAEAEANMEEKTAILAEMQAEPEVHRDPLTLFELRLRQAEWMMYAGQSRTAVRL
ncbi:dynamin family protein [Ectobacillus ponti]|uniref:Dynamin family protein n=1 Tax=Ectobacillus ponti TaxID=2961894 RepID=A0AA41X962_9BACI|nr:dynamin family protein [Ectobacillus ponti]MCP8971017.1 dynamin family protein [Ectobacillus ponti]